LSDGVEKGALDIIRNPANAYQLYINLVNSASNEIMLLLPAPTLERAEVVRLTLLSLEEAAGRGVKVRVLTTASKKLSAGSSVIVRHVLREGGEDLQEILIADRKASLEYCIKDGHDVVSIYSSSPSTAKSFVTIFDNLWEQAVAYEKFKEATHAKDEYIQKQRELYDKLREADRLKDEFINIAAHELRTPIMPILGGLELIESKLGGVDSSIKGELAIITRNAERLLKLSEDILQASRIETGRLRLYVEQFNLNALISEVITDLEKKYRQTAKAPSIETTDVRSLIMHIVGERSNGGTRKVITFEPGDPALLIECDRGKVGEVMFNLIDNAMKFVDEREGTIIVSTHLSGPNVIVSVRDNGTGIDPSIKDKMFEKFTTRSEKGSGLGLYIAKSIIEAHGGTIWAGNNSDGKGATFSFSLPIRFLRSEPPTPEQLPQITDNQRTIDQLKRNALEKIDSMKASLLEAREVAVRKRNEALERYQKQVDESRNLIRARQEFINQQISYKRMRREVDSRIEKGLEGLQRLIDSLRENIIGDETVEKIELHPTVSDAIRVEAEKITESEFFQSIRRQLQ
jgi:two-component system, OmpR family, sensor histidine kinase VicK